MCLKKELPDAVVLRFSCADLCYGCPGVVQWLKHQHGGSTEDATIVEAFLQLSSEQRKDKHLVDELYERVSKSVVRTETPVSASRGHGRANSPPPTPPPLSGRIQQDATITTSASSTTQQTTRSATNSHKSPAHQSQQSVFGELTAANLSMESPFHTDAFNVLGFNQRLVLNSRPC